MRSIALVACLGTVFVHVAPTATVAVIRSSPIRPTNSGEYKGISVLSKWVLWHGVVVPPRQCIRYIWRVDVGPLGKAGLDSGLEFSVAYVVEAVEEDST